MPLCQNRKAKTPAQRLRGMKLNHLNISTTEVRASAEIFERYFGFHSVNGRTTDHLAVLTNEEGFLLLFSHFDKDSHPHYPEDFHFGFILDSNEKVNAVYEQLHAAGLAATPPSVMHRSWTFYFHLPGNVLIEVQCMNPD